MIDMSMFWVAVEIDACWAGWPSTAAVKTIILFQIQSNIASLAYQPWACGYEKQKSERLENKTDILDGLTLAKNAKRLFPSNQPCGKILAEKLMAGGKTPYQINSIDDIAK